ncbi:UDP-glucose 4-epimerase GalE [Halocola ammonii]
MKKVLVTGGAGYIGSHTVVELIESGYKPVIVDNFSNSEPSVLDGIEKITGQKPEFHKADCASKKELREVFKAEGNFDGVIHFAAFKAVGESVAEPLKYYHNNLGSMQVLLELMQEFSVKNLVFSSSCTVYGQPETLPVTEDSPVQPANSPYGYTKQVCERMISDVNLSEQSELSAVLLRYFNPIGAHSSAQIGELPLGVPNNLVPFITQTAAGIREKLTVFGDDYKTADGTCVRDYIHVQDLARAHIRAFEWLEQNEGACTPFNVGTGTGSSVKEVINTFEKVSGERLNYEIGPRRAGDVESIYASPEKANKELNWKTEKSLEDAMKDAWRWQQNISYEKD